MAKANTKVPALNSNDIKNTLEQLYNLEHSNTKNDIKNSIAAELKAAHPEVYGPLEESVRSLNEKRMKKEEFTNLSGRITSTKRDVNKEKKKTPIDESRVSDLEASLSALSLQRENENKLITECKEAQKRLDERLHADNKAAKTAYDTLVKEHRQGENKKETLVLTGINLLYQKLATNSKNFTKFIKCHNLYALMVTQVLDDFVNRFNEMGGSVDEIMATFPLGRFMLSFARRPELPETPYMLNYINSLINFRECSINKTCKERLQEIFVNFIVMGVDCLNILFGKESNRLPYDDMINYFLSVYYQHFGRDESFETLMRGYSQTIQDMKKKKKKE
jgi:hypothetical protein